MLDIAKMTNSQLVKEAVKGYWSPDGDRIRTELLLRLNLPKQADSAKGVSDMAVLPDVTNAEIMSNADLMQFIRHAAYGDNWSKASYEIERRLVIGEQLQTKLADTLKTLDAVRSRNPMADTWKKQLPLKAIEAALTNNLFSHLKDNPTDDTRDKILHEIARRIQVAEADYNSKCSILEAAKVDIDSYRKHVAQLEKEIGSVLTANNNLLDIKARLTNERDELKSKLNTYPNEWVAMEYHLQKIRQLRRWFKQAARKS